ncbi:hypothetical protein BDA96_06G180000 [Sorghum bicolor]|uniref:Uncharacterized protein n=2 Tax=Sorghum bicolor TaxID=4558 RepID=A0A921UCU3_SORBI|nr:hypothetical protein BDA96_06G180000 [Sorghum bicolor]OQU82044.1 hypothetical protein SORBI_3006G163501 [Sorghum bicolor]
MTLIYAPYIYYAHKRNPFIPTCFSLSLMFLFERLGDEQVQVAATKHAASRWRFPIAPARSCHPFRTHTAARTIPIPISGSA